MSRDATRAGGILQAAVRDHSGIVLLLFLMAAAVSLLPAARLRIDTSLESFMMSDDPERDRNLEIKEEFSNDEILVAAFDLGRPFTAEDLRALNRLSSRIAEIKGVEEVLDLTTIEDVRGDEDFLDASPLVDLDTLEDSIEEIRRRAAGHRLYRANLLSGDSQVLAIVAVLELRDRGEMLNVRVTEALLQVLEDAPEAWATYLSGYPFSEQDASRILTRDLALLTPIAYAVSLLFVFVATRRIFPLLLITALVAWTELVTLAWFGLTDTPFSMVTSIAPAALLATSSAAAIYLFGLLRSVGQDRDPGVRLVVLLARPATLAALTTASGFLSLRLMPVEVIGELGTGLAVGIVGSLLGTLLLLPAMIQRWGLRLPAEPESRLSRWSTLGVRLADRPALPIVFAAVLIVVSLFGCLRIEVASDPLLYWSEDSYHRRSAGFVRDRLSGTLPINVLIHAGAADGALDPALLGFADRLVARLEESPYVDRTVSLLDYLYLIDAAMRPGEQPRSVPPSRELAAQYMLLYESGGDPDDYRHYVNHDRSSLNIFVRVNDRSSKVALRLRDDVEAFAREAAQPYAVEVLGTWFLFPKAMDAITRGMVAGLLTAMAAILAILALSLRSWRLALVAAIPNALPILVCLGLMGWFGIPLSFGSSIVGCVALGLAVDDTAHVLGHLQPGRSLTAVYRAVGPALILTTLILGVGFSCLALSQFRPVVHLGLGTAVTLIVALFADLLVLPSLLRVSGYAAQEELSQAT